MIYSKRTFIYDIGADDWKKGPSLLRARSQHSSCVIQSDDGTQDSIIIVGGETTDDEMINTTEIFKIRDQQWIPGPPFPCDIRCAACVSLPLAMDFACLVIGGDTYEDSYSSVVYGLNKSLTSWSRLGNIRKGRQHHIVLPLL